MLQNVDVIANENACFKRNELEWSIHLSRSLYLNFNYLVSVTAGGPVSPQGNMYPRSAVDFGWFVAFGEHQNIRCLKLIEIVILWVNYIISFGIIFFRTFSTFSTF